METEQFDDATTFDADIEGFEDAAEPLMGEIVKGRYKLPHPHTMRPHSWQRCTNFIKVLADTWALTAWEKRKIIEGLVRREDLYAEAHALVLADEIDTKELDRLAANCKDAAGANHGRRVGSALHKFTERHNNGQPHGAPERWAGKVELYAETLRKHGLRVDPSLNERRVVSLKYNVAGTFDNGLRKYTGALHLGDLKSQKQIYSYCDPAMQFAMYVNCDCMWDAEAMKYVDMPPFDKDEAYLLWLPVVDKLGNEVHECEIHRVDIAKGYRKLQLCADVYDWQKEGKRKNAVGGVVAAPSSLAMVEAYAQRLKAAETHTDLKELWDEAEGFGAWCPELQAVASVRFKEIQQGS